jgi:hypothetical protein
LQLYKIEVAAILKPGFSQWRCSRADIDLCHGPA